jgi:hypothetical protein
MPSVKVPVDIKQSPVRAIVYFSQLPTADNKQLVAVISQACRCQPVFVRQFGGNALIYEIILSPKQNFALFEEELLASGMPLGVQSVEQDVLMQHQQ